VSFLFRRRGNFASLARARTTPKFSGTRCAPHRRFHSVPCSFCLFIRRIFSWLVLDSKEVIYGSGYEVVSTAREFNKTFMALESHEQEAVGDAGEPSRKKQQGNTNKERSSVAKHDHASKSQGGATQGPRGGGSLAGGAGGGGKPPPRNNHKRNVQSKVAVSLEETDDNEELSLKKTTGKPSASSRTTKATEVTSSNKADAQPKKSGQTGKLDNTD